MVEGGHCCSDGFSTVFHGLRNLSIGALIGDVAQTPRAQHLAKVLQVDMDWKINEVSDGSCLSPRVGEKPMPLTFDFFFSTIIA